MKKTLAFLSFGALTLCSAIPAMAMRDPHIIEWEFYGPAVWDWIMRFLS